MYTEKYANIKNKTVHTEIGIPGINCVLFSEFVQYFRLKGLYNYQKTFKHDILTENSSCANSLQHKKIANIASRRLRLLFIFSCLREQKTCV